MMKVFRPNELQLKIISGNLDLFEEILEYLRNKEGIGYEGEILVGGEFDMDVPNQYQEPVSGNDQIKGLNIFYQYDPADNSYTIVVHDEKTGEEISSVKLYEFYTVKSHIEDILKRYGQ